MNQINEDQPTPLPEERSPTLRLFDNIEQNNDPTRADFSLLSLWQFVVVHDLAVNRNNGPNAEITKLKYFLAALAIFSALFLSKTPASLANYLAVVYAIALPLMLSTVFSVYSLIQSDSDRLRGICESGKKIEDEYNGWRKKGINDTDEVRLLSLKITQHAIRVTDGRKTLNTLCESLASTIYCSFMTVFCIVVLGLLLLCSGDLNNPTWIQTTIHGYVPVRWAAFLEAPVFYMTGLIVLHLTITLNRILFVFARDIPWPPKSYLPKANTENNDPQSNPT